METTQLQETKHLINAKKSYPSISIVLPTSNKYRQYRQDEEKLKLIINEVEGKLFQQFPTSVAVPLMGKLFELYQEIDFSHLSEGLAIYVSREQAEVFNLSFPVKEKVIIDKSFEIRDLLYETKHSHDYLVLLISSKGNKLLKGFNRTVEAVDFKDAPKDAKEWEIDLHSKVGNFSDAKVVKDITLEKYLRDIDRCLALELSNRDCPVIICGVERIVHKYKSITKNNNAILGYVEGNFDHATFPEIAKHVAVLLDKKNVSDENESLILLDQSIGKNTFAIGIRDVWKAAVEKRGRLLLVEKNYSCPAEYGKDKFTLNTDEVNKDSINYIKDAVDDLIEIVLKYGGDVAFVEDGKLVEHNHIALITYF
ncbi:MAG: hypothetical protein NTX97_05715 [Bacteroidetes bacterium]|nr:hypothetical protein [Bacteroidota bacterium]